MNTLYTLLALGFALPRAQAAPGEACKVVMIGGALSNESVMHRCFPTFEVVGLGNASSKLPGIATRIASDHSDQCYVIAGHSSGAIQAINLAQSIASKNPAKAKKEVYVVDFDGDSPNASLLNRLAGGKCVNAKTGGQTSRNYSVATNCPKPFQTTFVGPKAGGNMYAHFFMVNQHAPTDTSLGNFGSEGYAHCDPSDPLIAALSHPDPNPQSWNLCGDLCGK